jgi:hypothetical protein
MYRKTGIFKQNACHAFFCYWLLMEMQRAVRQVFIDFNQACDSERDVLTEFGVSLKLIGN